MQTLPRDSRSVSSGSNCCYWGAFFWSTFKLWTRQLIAGEKASFGECVYVNECVL